MKFNGINQFISPKARIGQNVKIGDHTMIYDNVIIGDGTIVSNHCVLGEPLSAYYEDGNYENPVTEIGANSMIRSHVIIYAGSSFGESFSTGHRVTIREFTKTGSGCRFGTLCDIQGYSAFGDYCWLHSNIFISQYSTVGNYVFIYPNVVFTNDPTPPSNAHEGPIIGDYSQIAAFSVLLPNVKIGQHCLIGAGSLVSKDVPDYQLVVGNPAKVVKDVREIKSRETGDSHYPWPTHFSRGMPWEKTGFENWIKENN